MDSKAPRAMMGKYFLMTHCIGEHLHPAIEGVCGSRTKSGPGRSRPGKG